MIFDASAHNEYRLHENAAGQPPPRGATANEASGIAIIGGGLSGLACALSLHDHQIGFELYERCGEFGGHARTNTVGCFRFDHGPHVLLGVPEPLLPTFSRLGLELKSCSCNSNIYFGAQPRKFIPAPIQQNLGLLSAGSRLACARDYLVNRFRKHRQPATYRQFLEQKLGRSFVDLFIEPYDSKRLTHALSEIHPDYSQRVASLSTLQMLRNAVLAPAATKGLDSSFLYPAASGIEGLSKALKQLIPTSRCHSNAELNRVRLRARQIVFADGRRRHFDLLVSSIPLVELIGLIDEAPSHIRDAAEHLGFASTYIFNLGFDRPLAGPHGIIRYPEPGVSFYRLSFPGSYSAGAVPEGCDAVAVEVSYHAKRRPKNPAEALARVYSDLRSTGITPGGAKVLAEQTIDIAVSHIVHTPKTPEALKLIHRWLQQQGIYCCGKYGEWRELLMPGSMLSGQHAAAAVRELQLSRQAA